VCVCVYMRGSGQTKMLYTVYVLFVDQALSQ